MTGFFREEQDFAQLAERVRTLRKRAAPVKLWSCACATGEEPYSAAMVLREAGCAGEILATDPAPEALAVARRGIYALEAVEGLGEERLHRHFFVRGEGAAMTAVLVRTELRAMVRFEQGSLRAGPLPAAGRFDFVFCRNVETGLDRAGWHRLLDRLATVIVPDGMLFLGRGETNARGHPGFAPCGAAAYLRVGRNPR